VCNSLASPIRLIHNADAKFFEHCLMWCYEMWVVNRLQWFHTRSIISAFTSQFLCKKITNLLTHFSLIVFLTQEFAEIASLSSSGSGSGSGSSSSSSSRCRCRHRRSDICIHYITQQKSQLSWLLAIRCVVNVFLNCPVDRLGCYCQCEDRWPLCYKLTVLLLVSFRQWDVIEFFGEWF